MSEKLIDKKVEHKTKPVFCEVNENDNKKLYEQIDKNATSALFDNSHNAQKFEKVCEKVENKKQNNQAFTTFNPFFGDKNALEAMSKKNYQDVVTSKDEPSPVLKIKQEISVGPIKRTEKTNKRKKLWITTLSICVVLFASVFGYNMVSINSLAKNAAKTQHQITEIEKTIEMNNNNYNEFLANSNLLEEMSQANTEGAQTVDLSPKNTEPKYATKTSAWDNFCNFFCRLFGK